MRRQTSEEAIKIYKWEMMMLWSRIVGVQAEKHGQILSLFFLISKYFTVYFLKSKTFYTPQHKCVKIKKLIKKLTSIKHCNATCRIYSDFTSIDLSSVVRIFQVQDPIQDHMLLHFSCHVSSAFLYLDQS